MSRGLACDDARALLVDALAEALATERKTALAAHLAGCGSCAEAERDLGAGWEMFRALPPVEPPAALREQVRDRVLAELEAERLSAARRQWFTVGQAPLAAASGVLVAAATLFLLGGLVWGDHMPIGHIFFCAAILTGLLVGAFSWIYSATTLNGLHLDAAARTGVLALAITVAATTMCPELHVLAWWDRSIIGRWLTDAIGAGGSSLVFGFGYGLVPGFLAALFGGRMLAERPIANALVAAAVVFFLTTPVIYLQSAPFTSGVIASWVAGIAAGTLCGVAGAFRVRRRVRVAALAL